MSNLIQLKQIDAKSGQCSWDISGATLPAASTKVVTSLFTGKTAGGTDTQVGVYTTSTDNHVEVRLAADGRALEDGGSQIFARLTFLTAVWTLTFYKKVAGSEVAFDFSGHDNEGDAFEFRWCETVLLANATPTSVVHNGEGISEISADVIVHVHKSTDLTVTSNGQTALTLPEAPAVNATTSLLINGVEYDYDDDYAISGVTLTWQDALFTLETTDHLVFKYHV